MDCNQARQHWNLYHDSEGDAELHFRIGEHLAMCPPCAQWFHQQSRLESLLAGKLRSQPETPAIWDHVLSRCGLKQPASGHRWLWFAGVAACVMLALGVAVYASRPTLARSPDLAKLSTEWHQRLEAGAETLQFRSDSDLAVEDYLRQRVSFPVRCPPRKDTGFVVQGAGVCRIADQPAAYLSGHVDASAVSIFVLPSDSVNTFPAQREALRQGRQHRSREGAYEVVMAVIDRNAVVVIGQTDKDRLDRVLRAYGTYPH